MALKYGDITEKIIGCAITVHKKMGSGYSGLIYSKELGGPIYYDEVTVGKRRVDFLVEDNIAVELKDIAELSDKELYQGLNYLESHKLEIGLLINFGTKSLPFRRLINEKRLFKENYPSNPLPNPENPRL